jgi:hypothetical protein
MNPIQKLFAKFELQLASEHSVPQRNITAPSKSILKKSRSIESSYNTFLERFFSFYHFYTCSSQRTAGSIGCPCCSS